MNKLINLGYTNNLSTHALYNTNNIYNNALEWIKLNEYKDIYQIPLLTNRNSNVSTGKNSVTNLLNNNNNNNKYDKYDKLNEDSFEKTMGQSMTLLNDVRKQTKKGNFNYESKVVSEKVSEYNFNNN